MKYSKYFKQSSDYQSFKNSSEYILPNVSYVEETKGVSFEPKKAFVLRAKYNATPDNLVAFTDASNIASLKVNGNSITIEPIKNENTTFDVLGENISLDMETGTASFPESYLIKSPVSRWSFKAKDPNYVMNENTYVCILGMVDGMTMAQPLPLEEAMGYAFTTNDGVTLELVDAFLAEMNIEIQSGMQIGFTLCDMDTNNGTFVFIDTEYQTNVTTGGLPTYSFDSEGSYDVEIELADPDRMGIGFTWTPLISIEIGDGITSIGDAAFEDCRDLTSVTIGSDVTEIGNSAFCGCTKLTSINIPNSVTSIGEDVFRGCTGLISINIPNGVTSISDYAFFACTGLTEIIIPDSVTTIGTMTFGMCSSLNEIICKGNIAPQIQNDTFGNYYNQMKKFGVLTVPDNADYSSWMSTSSYYLGYYRWTCSNIPVYDLVCAYDVNNISNNTKLYASTDFTPYMMIINGEKLSAASNYKFNEIGQHEVIYRFLTPISEIETSTFYNCTNLTSINIPDSVKTIGYGAFDGCISLPMEDNLRYADTYLVGAVDKSLSTYTIKTSTKWIGTSAFEGCSSLTSINIPDSVTTIDSEAFHNCSRLTSINIPNSVTSIKGSAFQTCSGLTSITIPDSVTSIGAKAFEYCYSLKEITCNAIISPTIDYTTFKDVSTNGVLRVPEGSDYSTWMRTSNYYLGKYNWTVQYI